MSRAEQAGRRCARRCASAGATHHFDLDRRRHRLAVQPARRRRRLQPGVPRPPADRRRARRRSSSAPARSTPRCAAALAADGVRVAPYDDAAGALAALPAGAVLLDRSAPHHARPARAQPGRSRHRGDQPEHARQEPQERRRGAPTCAAPWIEDGAAMCEFYAWFEAALADPSRRSADHRADDRREAHRGARAPARLRRAELRDDRRLQRQRRDAALPRDAANRTRRSQGDGLLLIDSGAQYLGGTTDITRMWPIGAAQRGAAARRTRWCCRARWPCQPHPLPARHARRRCSTRSRARRSGQHGLDYGHGTGHGVGYFLNVHEGPQTISRAVPEPAMAMQPGMITSIEPGLYRPGQWGVRVENLVLNVPAPQRRQRVRRVPRVRDADALPDRHALHRALAAARRRDRLAQRATTRRSRAPGAASRAAPRSPGCACAPRRSDAEPRGRRRSAWRRRIHRALAQFVARRAGFVAMRFRRGEGVPRVRSIASRSTPSRSPP